ncbi:MAG: lysine--tRNA ligase [Deltaproteobacteria bacterium RBG_16_48_10]|nr:MAG: lysine--tRNA ligase [Deltaproteobacteria bacterium RBG_16_48_10]
MDEISELIQQRVRKLEALRNEGINPFPNHYKVKETSKDILDAYGSLSDEDLHALNKIFSIGGRIIAVRDFGKASFVQIQDRKGRIQAYVRKDLVGESAFQLFKKLDMGDFIRVEGKIFRTKTHELTIQVQALQLLAKSLRPLPEKWHGLTDVETRYRQRYLDLIANPRVKEIFLTRIQAIQTIREFFISRDFLEVETPMMHPIPGGATAKPFKTHHNALDMELFMRVAPELYLKRLVIGGLERVFEINRNFRNEGISTQHNPEFTMLEFYQSYATYEDLMAMTEELFCSMVQKFHGGLKLTYGGKKIDFTPPWKRIPLKDSLIEIGKLDPTILKDPKKAEKAARDLGLELKKGIPHGRILGDLFEEKVEPDLLQPTFITHYPTEISPLSRRNEADPEVADRFELFISGREIANGFSELNDPPDQKERFLQQIKEKFEETDLYLRLDEDFLRALEFGMPPTAGEGVGIDRWVMILADAPSIRDVILFPLLRMEK